MARSGQARHEMYPFVAFAPSVTRHTRRTVAARLVRAGTYRSWRVPALSRADRQDGSVHFWLAPPVQSQICSRVPLAELGPVASRQRPDAGFTSEPPDACHF
jgi:hypothetical protein